ncbi:ABC transporter substrate-binding protein [Pseudonocardia kujensis]|uniref:ABC transporter substrate-binding protein n=1 Tax=Pseudonocardia kujensis TaxID=1128675 RepID=UPI001E620E7C|nr:ABC transporter substrate-binding protein [Pseudonocardia kujensis]MCE0762035.1 ABC transporter substrate-binding protein [Pseudonocardia kujensis]
MTRLRLTMAIGAYDHVRDLATGAVRCEGVDLNVLEMPVEEIFHRFIAHRQFDVSEVSMGKFSALRAAGDDSLVGLPVFPSRMFRHSSIYVRRDSGLTDPARLAGLRVGIPEWAQTAAVYSRGLLQHRYGVDLSSITWVQAGVNQPGRREKVALSLPGGIVVERRPGDTLTGLLVDGEVDAVLSAHAPDCFFDRPDVITRMFEDSREVEQEYFAGTGIFPIMHAVAVRRDLVEANPWLLSSLYKAFIEARDRSLARARESSVSFWPLPWAASHVREVERVMGTEELWPYGIEANRRTLDAFLQFGLEQGVLGAPLDAADMFASAVDDLFRI